jgi:type I restriction enzyme R subunit
VQHYRSGIAQLFDFNALVIVSDGGLVGHAEDDTPHAAGSTLHGMWTAPWEWYAPWKSVDGRSVVESAAGAMKTLIAGLFPKERLLHHLRHFIAFEVVNEKIEKKGAKYHQYFGVRFVAYTGDNTVAVFDLETMEVTDKIPSGKQADGIALATFSE